MKAAYVLTVNMNPKPYYKTYGNGTPVLILHGWGGSNESWEEFCKQLNDEFTWVVPDLPGFGKTPPPPSSWDVNKYTEWVIEFYKELPKELQAKYLLTHSFGGRIAAKWLSRTDQPFKKAVLTAVAGLKPEPTIRQKIKAAISKLKIFIPQSLYYPTRKLFYKITGVKDFPTDKNLQESFKLIVNEDLYESFLKIDLPVQLVWGQQDSYTPLKDGHKINQAIKNSKLTIIKEAKHGIHRQTPKKLATICLQFFKD